jgi:hypothetical protein
MRWTKAVSMCLLIAVVGVTVVGCSPARSRTRQETRVEKRTEDRMDRRR